MQNFLSHQKQRVRIHDEYSCWIEVLSGIPQGSILGPLLFTIFINDLVSTCDDNVNLYLFADDAKLYCHIKDDVDKVHLQIGIDIFVEWTDKWEMK